MSSTTFPCSSFREWYVKEEIPGHCFLIPSLYVVNGYQRIFSKIEGDRCESLVEVICRLVLFLVLPIIALLALVSTPFGLLVKGIATCCCDTTHASSGNNDLPTPAVTHTVNNDSSFPNTRSTSAPSILKKQLSFQLQMARTELNKIEKILNHITSTKNIESEKIQNAKRLLNQEFLKELLATAPQKGEGTLDPLQKFCEDYRFLEGKITSLEYLHVYYSRTLENNELFVAADGDCLFHSFVEHVALNGEPILPDAALQERQQAMDWIAENYTTNEKLQLYLINSMYEHYLTQLDRCINEQQSLRAMFDANVIQTDFQKEQLKKNSAQLSERCIAINDCIFLIEKAKGQAGAPIDFSFVLDLVKKYIQTMRESGQHGGLAELFALSTLHQFCAIVYSKDEVTVTKPYLVLNSQFPTKRYFTHTYNHFNPYFPPFSPPLPPDL